MFWFSQFNHLPHILSRGMTRNMNIIKNPCVRFLQSGNKLTLAQFCFRSRNSLRRKNNIIPVLQLQRQLISGNPVQNASRLSLMSGADNKISSLISINLIQNILNLSSISHNSNFPDKRRFSDVIGGSYIFIQASAYKYNLPAKFPSKFCNRLQS